MNKIEKVDISEIHCGKHAQRMEIDEEALDELAGSIRSVGLIQPLTVRMSNKGYELVAGHRRLEACKKNGMEEVDCLVMGGGDVASREVTFAENFFREDLTPVELAMGINDEYESGRMTIEQMARGFNRTTDWVKRQMAMLHWPREILEVMHGGGLSVAALANLAAVGEPQYRSFLLRNALENGASAGTTRLWLAGWRAQLPGTAMEVAGGDQATEPILPAVPQAVCLGCNRMERTDAMSHVPLCVDCIRIIREGKAT